MTAFIEKRKDHLLRTSINRLQSLMVNSHDVKLLYERTLKSAMDISGSRFGIIVLVNHEERSPQLNQLVLMDFRADVADHSRFQTVNLHNRTLNNYWQSFMDHPVPVILNRTPSDEFHEILPDNLPKMDNSLTLPVLNRGQVAALLVLTNCEVDYDQAVIDRLQPLLVTFICVFRSSEMTQIIGDVAPPKSNLDSSRNIHLDNLINASLNGVVIVDQNRKILMLNAAAERIFDIQSETVMGQLLDQFIVNAEDITSQYFARTVNSDRNRSFSVPKVWRNVVGQRSNKENFLMDLSTFHSQLDDGYHTTFIIDDISDRVNAARESKEALQRFKTLTNLAPVGIIQVDNNWVCNYVNDTWCELSGQTRDETLGQGWVNAIHVTEVETVLEELRYTTKTGKAFQKSFRLQTQLGHITWVRANARSLYDDHGLVSGFLGTFSDITDHLATEKKLRDIAEYDQLTGLVNRSFFRDRLQRALESSYYQGNVNLLFIDLDGFKSVNDTFGHAVGDRMLKLSAERIKNSVREEDIVARIGGDEFTVILTHMHDDSMASRVAEKIIHAMRAPFLIDSQEIFITTSVGIAVSGEHCADPDTLIKQADFGLYRAKMEGKNKFQFFTSELDAQDKERMFLSNGLHRALEREEFRLCYQPQVDMQSGNIIGFEALLRWQHPEKGELLPSCFITLLEETGLIEDIGIWVIRHSCQQLARWLNLDHYNAGCVTISVNLSARQLKDPKLPEAIDQILKETHLSGSHLILEITETMLMGNTDSNEQILLRLRDLGVSIALDDFGTGYSSLAYLKRFPITHLKIDRSFVRDILQDEDDEAIILAILAMAKSLKINVTAEGVENSAVLDRLKTLGCERYQGYYFSKPISAEAIKAQFYSDRSGKFESVENKDHQKNKTNEKLQAAKVS